jgi:hypothetical protein
MSDKVGMVKGAIGVMFGAAMSYYMFTLAGGIPLSLNWNNSKDEEIYDDNEYIEIQNGEDY